jgi:hypothetical protein
MFFFQLSVPILRQLRFYPQRVSAKIRTPGLDQVWGACGAWGFKMEGGPIFVTGSACETSAGAAKREKV